MHSNLIWGYTEKQLSENCAYFSAYKCHMKFNVSVLCEKRFSHWISALGAKQKLFYT